MKTAIPSIGLADVHEARERIAPYLPPTPLVQHPAFKAALGLDVWLKLETAQPTGAFKVRGGVNYMAARADDVRACGIVSASTGNHGGSLAYGGALFGVPVTIYVPENANPAKVASMRAMGANVVRAGVDGNASAAAAREAAAASGARFISSGNEPLLIAGVATAALEAFDVHPFDVLVVQAAAGSNAAGTSLVAKSVAPNARVIAVASAQAPAVHDAWHTGHHVKYDSLSTVAEGLASRESYDFTQAIMREYLDEFALVDDAEILDAMRFIIEQAHQLVEPAGAASLAYVLRHRDELRGKRIYVPLTGANIAYDDLRLFL